LKNWTLEELGGASFIEKECLISKPTGIFTMREGRVNINVNWMALWSDGTLMVRMGRLDGESRHMGGLANLSDCSKFSFPE
jgi:hypothetical protein